MFAPICREIFTLSFEIMVILDWTSPLKQLLRVAMESQHNYVNVVIVGDFNIPEIDWDANAVLGNSSLAHVVYSSLLEIKKEHIDPGQEH